MRASLRARLRTPSPAMVIAVAALVVALGGTAVAATATIVNIADPATPAHVAAVDATGALKTAGTVGGYVGQAAPRTAFANARFMVRGTNANMLVGATHATLAFTRFEFANYYDQINGATVQVTVTELRGNSTTCDGSGGQQIIGIYDVPAGQTVTDEPGSPIVLKPAGSGLVWCLAATLVVQGNPTGYLSPAVSWSGFLVAGTLPAPAPPAIAARANGAPPRIGR